MSAFSHHELNTKASLTRGRIGAALMLATLVAGCATESVDLLFVRPGQFDYLSCAEIATATQNAATREQELKTLTERAERESFGVLVAAAAYRSDYLRAQGQLRLLSEAAQNKKCPPAASPPSSPSARR
jgi:hypothetical protein